MANLRADEYPEQAWNAEHGRLGDLLAQPRRSTLVEPRDDGSGLAMEPWRIQRQILLVARGRTRIVERLGVDLPDAPSIVDALPVYSVAPVRKSRRRWIASLSAKFDLCTGQYI